MAERLARIYGTEEDKVNCPFYLKMGACRHGDRCSRIHNKPVISQTILIQNMYTPPAQEIGPDGQPVAQDPRDLQEHFEDFYEDICEELLEIGGDLETVEVCQNLSDHLRGNVYAKFDSEEAAQRALTSLMGRYYAGRPILPQFSPVLDFREARCRQFEEAECQRGGYCNFMHLKHVSSKIRRRYGLLRPDRDERDREPRDGHRDRDYRERDRYDRHDHHSRHGDRDRARDRGRGPMPDDDDERWEAPRDHRGDDPRAASHGGEGGAGSPPGEETDEARRARIAAWKAARRDGPGPAGPDAVVGP